MRRFILPLLLFVLILSGCAGHSSRHTSSAQIMRCATFPCGGQVITHDVVLKCEVDRLPSDEFVLSGVIEPRGVPEGTKVEFAQLSFELARDVTIFDSFSFPIVTRDMTLPLRFKHTFKPSGGFDGLTFNLDMHLQR